jgi:hypothetical protein
MGELVFATSQGYEANFRAYSLCEISVGFEGGRFCTEMEALLYMTASKTSRSRIASFIG